MGRIADMKTIKASINREIYDSLLMIVNHENGTEQLFIEEAIRQAVNTRLREMAVAHMARQTERAVDGS